MRRILQGLGTIACACVLACGGASNDSLRAKLDSRARFDLGCSDIQLAPLEETNGYIVSYGVTGCGRRVTYVINATTESWVMNVADGQPTGQSPEERQRRGQPVAPPPHHPR